MCRQKQRHWAAEMEVKVDELAKLADAIRTERATLAARRASLEVSATMHGPSSLPMLHHQLHRQ